MRSCLAAKSSRHRSSVFPPPTRGVTWASAGRLLHAHFSFGRSCALTPAGLLLIICSFVLMSTIGLSGCNVELAASVARWEEKSSRSGRQRRGAEIRQKRRPCREESDGER